MKSLKLVNIAKLVAMLVAVLMAVAFFSGNALASNSGSSVHYRYVTVTAGQTLWNLASKYRKSTEARDWIATLVDLNNLQTSDLQPGQRIALPN